MDKLLSHWRVSFVAGLLVRFVLMFSVIPAWHMYAVSSQTLPMWMSIAIACVCLVVELAVVTTLQRMVPRSSDTSSMSVWFFYWCSPVIIFLVYWSGCLMLFPVALVLFALLCLFYNSKPRLSALALLLASVISFDAWLVVPFIFICVWRHKGLSHLARPFTFAFFIGAVVMAIVAALFPQWFSSAFYQWQVHIAQLARLQLSGTTALYIFPLIYLLYAYAVWRMRRVSLSLLCGLLGVGFIVTAILSPSVLSWFVWVMPFVVLHQVRASSDEERIVIFLFSCFFVVVNACLMVHPFIPLLHVSATSPWVTTNTFWTPLLLNAIDMGWFVIGLSMCVKGIRQHPDYLLTRKPLMIGISGDSGTGKDTLSSALAGLFDTNAVRHISGDDYHLWDRLSPMWKKFTHLNPQANDLYRFSKDILDLLKNKWVLTRPYNHQTGHFDESRYSKQGDVILASGLHTLLVPELKSKFDVKVFLAMEESLRVYLKKQRDIYHRGKTEEEVVASIATRKEDGDKYIEPQAEVADIIFNLMAAETLPEDGKKMPGHLPMRLNVTIKQASYYQELASYLIDACGVTVAVEFNAKDHTVVLRMEGDPDDAQVAKAAEHFLPQFQGWFSRKPVWYGGMRGLMQLIVVLHAAEMLHARVA